MGQGKGPDVIIHYARVEGGRFSCHEVAGFPEHDFVTLEKTKGVMSACGKFEEFRCVSSAEDSKK